MPERFEGQELPKVPERAAEQAERRVEGAEGVEQAVEEAVGAVDAKAAAFASVDAKTVMAPSDVPASELAGDAAFAESQKEMGAVQDEARGLVGRTKDKLSGVLAKLKRYGRVAAAAGVIAGSAFPASEAAAHEPGPGSKIEHVEKGQDAAKQGDPVTRKAVEALRSDKDLAAQFGAEQIEAFAESIGRWDGAKMDAALAEIAGIDASRLQKESIKELRLLSDAELKAMHDKDPRSVDLQMKAVTTNDRVLLRASAFIDAEGAVNGKEVLHTVAHESLHVEHTRSDKVRFGEQQRPWDDVLPHGVQEGVTEVLALRGLERMGETSPDQSYAGGNFAAGLLLEKLAGTRALARDYISGTVAETRKALEAKVGADGADRILRKRFYTKMGSVGNEPEALSTAVDILRESARSGMDSFEMVSAAVAGGVVERMQVIGNSEGIVLSKEIPNSEIRVIANAAVEDETSLTPHAPPVRVHVLSQGAGSALETFDARQVGEKLRNAAGIIEKARGEFIAAHGLSEGFEKDKDAKAAYDVAIDDALVAANARIEGLDKKFTSVGETFNVVLNAASAMKPFREAYDRATTAAERDAIRQQMADQAQRISKDVLSRIGSAARDTGSADAAQKKTAP